MKVVLPSDLTVDAEVDLYNTDGDYFIRARLNISLPGIEREIAQVLVDEADQVCPYSKATRGNIDVLINLVKADSTPLVIVDTRATPEKRL